MSQIHLIEDNLVSYHQNGRLYNQTHKAHLQDQTLVSFLFIIKMLCW